MAAHARFKPKTRSNPLIGSAAYTWDDLGRFHNIDTNTATTDLIARLTEQRFEHCLGVKKAKLPSKFSAPKISDFNTLSELDSHYSIEKALKASATNFGILKAFKIAKERTAYVEYRAAVTATDGTVTTQEREEAAATYNFRDMFKLDLKFTDTEIRESCKIYNTHWDDRYNSANALSM